MIPRTVMDHMQAIQQMVSDGAIFAVNHSGGKDSQATYAVIQALVPADQIIVVHADLGEVEWPGIQDHIRSNIDHELHIAQAIYKDGSTKRLLDMVERRGKWPSAGQRYCTSDLKRGPANKVIRAYAERRGIKKIVSCFGFRAEESAARAKRAVWAINNRMSRAGREWIDFSPIHDLSVDQVWQVIDASGQVRHPAYDAGMSRLSCCFCILSNQSDLRIAARLRPSLLGKYLDLEEAMGHTFRNGQSLAELTSNLEAA